jgi:hypothetical protein
VTDKQHIRRCEICRDQHRGPTANWPAAQNAGSETPRR